MLVLENDFVVGIVNEESGRIYNEKVKTKIFNKRNLIAAKGSTEIYFIQNRIISGRFKHTKIWEFINVLSPKLSVTFYDDMLYISGILKIRDGKDYTRISVFNEHYKKYRGVQSLSPKWGPPGVIIKRLLQTVIEDYSNNAEGNIIEFKGKKFYGRLIDNDTIQPAWGAPLRMNEIFEPAGKTFGELYDNNIMVRRTIVSKNGEIGEVYNNEQTGHYIIYKQKVYGDKAFWNIIP